MTTKASNGLPLQNLQIPDKMAFFAFAWGDNVATGK